MIDWLALVVLGTMGMLFLQRWGEYENRPGRRRVDHESVGSTRRPDTPHPTNPPPPKPRRS